jgi:hypothetical protein
MQLEKNPYILAEPDSGIDANVVGGVQEPRVQLGLIDTEQSLGSWQLSFRLSFSFFRHPELQL